MQATVWKIRLFNGFQVDHDSETLPRFSTNQTSLLFAILADRVGRSIRREELIELLWPGVERDTGRNRLRVALAYLRRVLEPSETPVNSVLLCSRSDVLLPSAACEVDADLFTRWTEKGKAASDREEAIRCYSAADRVYQGKFLAGWPGEWVQERQLHYTRLQLQAQSKLSRLHEDMGDAEAALRVAFRASAADPLREAPVRRVVALQLANQDVSGALDEYERYRILLKNEVGLIPTYELRSLAKRIKFELALQRSSGGSQNEAPRASLGREASFDQLSAADQAVLSKLCVFQGSFEPMVAGIVAGASLEDLERLMAAHFLGRERTPREVRYSVVEKLRVHCWAQSTESAQREVLERHAAYYRQLVKDVESLNINGGIQQRVRLSSDSENLRLAVQTTFEAGDVEAISNFLTNLTWHWTYEGQQREGLRLIQEAREICQPSGLNAVKLEFAEGIIAAFHDDAELGLRCLSSSIPKLAAAGMQQVAMVGRVALGYALYVRGDLEGYLEQGCTSQREFRERGMARWDAFECHLLGCTLCQLDRLEESTYWHGEAERIWRELGDLPYEGFPHLGRARIAFMKGEIEQADRLYATALGHFRKWKDARAECYALEGLARNAAANGRFLRAAFILGAVEKDREEMGLARDFVDRRDFNHALAMIRGNLGEGYRTEWAEGRKLSRSEAVDWALIGIDVE